MCRVYFLELGGGFFYSAFPRNNNSLKIFFSLIVEPPFLESMQIWNGPENNHSTRREEMAFVFLSLLFYALVGTYLILLHLRHLCVWVRRQESPGLGRQDSEDTAHRGD